MSDAERTSGGEAIAQLPEAGKAEEHSRPLTKGAKFLLICGATLSILLCYLFALVSLCGLLIWIVLEAILFVILLRFGLAGFLLDFIVRHCQLAKIFVLNLWLSKGVEYQLSLRREDAEEMFAMLDTLAHHFHIRPPDEVKVEMNCGAWVMLRGYRKGAGKTILGVGFDLLAALSVGEFRAVLAHEMAHAKLVRRGLKRWLNGGLGRIAQLSEALQEFAEICRSQNGTPVGTAFFRDCADKITRVAARQVAAYSRQDEFEADRGAADFCGAQPLKDSLQRLEAIVPRLSRIPWSERVGRAATEPSFCEWLKCELGVPPGEASEFVEPEAHDPYSTHPTLADRLRALPDTPGRFPSDMPAMALLEDADNVAAALFRELQSVLAVQEAKDARMLERRLRKGWGSMPFGWGHLPSLVLFLGGLFTILAFLVNMESWWLILAALLLFAGSRWALKLARYRDRSSLPVPRFAELKKAWRAPLPPDLQDRETKLKEEYKTSGWGGKKQKQGFEDLLRDANQALGQCDYLHAHVASGLALEMNDRSVEGALAHAIASASFRMDQHVAGLLAFIRARSAFSSAQTKWGAAWVCVLIQDWPNAEAFLMAKHKEDPREVTFLLLLAFVQWNRGKFQSAIRNAQNACSLKPGDVEGAKLLCECLLDAGHILEATERLAALQQQTEIDAEMSLMLMRLSLLRRDLEATENWASRCRSLDSAAKGLVSVGNVFETARLDEQAFVYFRQAADQAYYPEAHLGLGRILFRKREMSAARQELFSAMNLSRELGPGALAAPVFFSHVLGQLMQIDRKRCPCRAWTVAFKTQQISVTPPLLRGCRFLVYASVREAAAGYLDEVLAATQPGSPVARASEMVWNDAPQQPVRPVYPGVQMVMGE